MSLYIKEMIETNQKNNNIGDNKNMSSEYKELENGKVECLKCSSVVSKSGYSRHTKTLKHTNGRVNKTGGRYEQMRETTADIRERNIFKFGLDKVRERERIKKAKQRALLKQKKNEKKPTEHKEHKEEKEHKEHNNLIDEFKSTQKQVQQISNNKERAHLKDVINKARAEVLSGSKTIEQAKTLIKSKIKQFNADESKNNNCKDFIQNLDNRNISRPDDPKRNVERETLRKYIESIGRIYEGMTGDNFDCKDFGFLRNTIAVINYIEKRKFRGKLSSDGTKRNYYNAIRSILGRLKGYDTVNEVYQNMLNSYTEKVDKARGDNRMNEKESKNYIPWTDIVKYNDPEWTDEGKLLFKLYTAIPPRRIKDYSLMKYVKGKSVPVVKEMDKDCNYIVLNNNKNPIALVFNNYKTKKVYGQFIVDLTLPDGKPHFRYSEIKKAIKQAYKSTNARSGELVFPSANGRIIRDFTRTWLYYLFRGTGKQIGVNDLRHSFLTYLHRANSEMSDNTIRKFASYMGHSSQMSRSYRRIDAPTSPIESDDDD